MSHHWSEPRSFSNEELNKMRNQEKAPLFGPTGKFPDGKLTENDEGGIQFGVTVHEGRILLDFGKPIQSIGFTAEEAKILGQILLDRARQID